MSDKRPNDGGSWRRGKNGKYVRNEPQQQPNPGKTALAKPTGNANPDSASKPSAGENKE